MVGFFWANVSSPRKSSRATTATKRNGPRLGLNELGPFFPHEGIFGVVLHGGEVHTGDDIQVVKLGDGTCSFTPAEALKEVERARREGTL